MATPSPSRPSGCACTAKGGPLYASRTTLRQLLAKQPHLVRLNRWAAASPSGIAAIELLPQPTAIMEDGGAVARQCVLRSTKRRYTKMMQNISNKLTISALIRNLTQQHVLQSITSVAPPYRHLLTPPSEIFRGSGEKFLTRCTHRLY